jgi:hypothetical protein
MKRRRTTEEIRESKRRLAEEVEAIKQDIRTALMKGIKDGRIDVRRLRQDLAELEHAQAEPGTLTMTGNPHEHADRLVLQTGSAPTRR